MITIFTIGHSSKAISVFLEKLQENKIDILVDIRTHPQSRFCPWFNMKVLDGELSKVGIVYVFKGNNLGGKGENVEYEETIDELVSLANKGKRVCVMCSEGDYKKCHRHEMIEPSLIEKGVNVEHIIYDKIVI